MHNLPFTAPGRFFRGNLHTHSTCSDGAYSPAEVVDAYRAQGYDFLAITDHWFETYGYPITDTRPHRTKDFVTLLGAELHAPGLPNDEIWHLIALGLPPDFTPDPGDLSGPALAARAAEAGAFVGFAHPAWYGLTLEDARTVEAAHAVEAYNHTCTLLNDRGDSWYLMDLLLSEGRRVSAYAADDAHFWDPGTRTLIPGQFADAFGGWVHVRAEELDPDAILASLKAGHFYSSQGPLIHNVTLSEGQIEVVCSPASAIYLSGAGWKALRRFGSHLTRCAFPLDQFIGSYCRVTVVDTAGRKAWSNPIWLD